MALFVADDGIDGARMLAVTEAISLQLLFVWPIN
jgi:hypothetical protein